MNRKPIVLSMSAINAFKRCRKSFELAYVMNRDVESNAAAKAGTEFHEIMADSARYVKGIVPQAKLLEHSGKEMLPVAQAYLTHKPLPAPEDILLVEEPIYTLLIDEDGELPAVYVRTTFDRVDQEGDWIVGKDYKTFAKMPSGESLSGDLDFQLRLYTAVLRRYFNTRNVRFDWEYVRREVGRELKGKGYVEWPVEERYVTVEVITPEHELQALWAETQYVVSEIRSLVLAYNPYAWYRVDLKGDSPFTCHTCFYKELCKAQLQHGQLDEQTLELLSTPRNEARGMTYAGVMTDPRVVWLLNNGKTPREAALAIYGEGYKELEPK